MGLIAQWLAIILLIGGFLLEAAKLSLKIVDVYDQWRARARLQDATPTPAEAPSGAA